MNAKTDIEKAIWASAFGAAFECEFAEQAEHARFKNRTGLGMDGCETPTDFAVKHATGKWAHDVADSAVNAYRTMNLDE